MAKDRAQGRTQDRTSHRANWLEGPQIPGENDGLTPSKWPGEKLGLAKTGAGSQASIMRRCGGVALDWLVSMAITGILFYLVPPATKHGTNTELVWGNFTATTNLMVFVVVGIVSVWLFARTPGQFMVGMGVARIDNKNARVGLWRAAVRTILAAFILPAAICDSDLRGMHDRATGTAVIRT
ncbi:RDD family protein [Corynebacterium kroppenstedtii]|uniref:RDD family protein n=1 Tax=Corynebacterium sp. PCR 32 TaxID=3351342 RepID=UPI0030B69BEC